MTKKYICENNEEHVVESLPEDLFCPLCPDGIHSMLIPMSEKEQSEDDSENTPPIKKYFVLINNNRQGPYNLSQLTELDFKKTDLVWCKGMTDWLPAGEIPDLEFIFKKNEEDLPPPAPEQDSKSENNNNTFTNKYDRDDYKQKDQIIKWYNIFYQTEFVSYKSMDSMNKGRYILWISLPIILLLAFYKVRTSFFLFFVFFVPITYILVIIYRMIFHKKND